jgi:hypothetical protein
VQLAEATLVQNELIRLFTSGREHVVDEIASALSDADADAKPS